MFGSKKLALATLIVLGIMMFASAWWHLARLTYSVFLLEEEADLKRQCDALVYTNATQIAVKEHFARKEVKITFEKDLATIRRPRVSGPILLPYAQIVGKIRFSSGLAVATYVSVDFGPMF